MIDFVFFRVDADYKPEHRTNGVIGYGIIAETMEEAQQIRERMLSNSKVQSANITTRRVR